MICVDIDPPANDWFYPARKRCLTCRRFFGPLVIKRLYDSYECAGMEPPSSDPADWPREHKTAVGEAKTAYTDPNTIDGTRHQGDAIWLYDCSYCGMYHLGHRNLDAEARQAEQFRKNLARIKRGPVARGRRRGIK